LTKAELAERICPPPSCPAKPARKLPGNQKFIPATKKTGLPAIDPSGYSPGRETIDKGVSRIILSILPDIRPEGKQSTRGLAGSSFFQQNHVLNVMGMGEHIYRAHPGDPVDPVHQLNIPGLCRGITAYINYP
jgi:hypothetical protein